MDSPTERDAAGRFVNGHPGGPGRPPREFERRFLDALRAMVTAEHWQSIVQRAIDDAQAGDRHARAWLADRLLGPVVRSQEPPPEATALPNAVDNPEERRRRVIEALRSIFAARSDPTGLNQLGLIDEVDERDDQSTV